MRQVLTLRQAPAGVRATIPNPLSLQTLNTDILPHTMPQAQGGLLMQQMTQGPQQQLLLSQMQVNPQMLNQLSLQHPPPVQQPQQMQVTHIINVGGSPQTVQMLTKSNISPKRSTDPRAIINSNTHQQQQQQPSFAIPPSPQNLLGAGLRPPRPTHIPLSYYGQTHSQPSPPGQGPLHTQQQSYFGEVLHPLQVSLNVF